MAFVLQDVINEIEESLSLEPLKKLKKENLVQVAAYFGITPVVSTTNYCINNDIIDEIEEKPTAETAEVLNWHTTCQCLVIWRNVKKHTT